MNLSEMERTSLIRLHTYFQVKVLLTAGAKHSNKTTIDCSGFFVVVFTMFFYMIIHLFLSLTGICQQFSMVVTKTEKIPGGQSFLASIQNPLIFATLKRHLNLTRHGVNLGALII